MKTLLNSAFKIPVIVVGVIVAVILLAFGTISILKIVSPIKKEDASHAELSLAKIRDAAAIAENTGDTDKALVYYRQALANYVSRDNKNGIADITAKITQLEKWKIEQKTAKEQSITEAKQRAAEAGAPDPTLELIAP